MWKLMSIVIICLLGFSPLSQSKGLTKVRKTAHVQEDLSVYSGSYNLVSGSPRHCPDGEFSAGENRFSTGASFRITRINQPARTEPLDQSNSCQLKTQAVFDGKTLVETVIETCADETSSTKVKSFTFNKTDTSQYIKLQFIKKLKEGDTYKSNIEFECLYSRNMN